jgi:hypothetical protein
MKGKLIVEWQPRGSSPATCIALTTITITCAFSTIRIRTDTIENLLQEVERSCATTSVGAALGNQSTDGMNEVLCRNEKH